ncbi:MAG: metallophosphoesterase [Romboutsia sp.]|uniref:metallophosphoesterase n=1 Tax=Romboutsia sp. TaxID=1965302 RepID=UPI003F3AA56A
MIDNKKNIFKFISIILILVIVYSAIIEPNLLVVKKFNLDLDGKIIEEKIKDKNTESFKIVHISDTQIGYFYSAKRLKGLAKKINNLNPDIVVFTGDLIDYANKKPDIDRITENLSKIDAKIGKFTVFGNHDYMYDLPKYYTEIMKNSGFNLLVNENKRIRLSNEKYINIIGLDEKLNGKPSIEKYDKEMDIDDFNLVLMHNPDVIEEFKDSKIDLMLSGHSHGGQVSIPLKGAILTPPYGRKYTKGFYEVNGNNLFVTSGLGSTKLPFRLLNVPEIVEINIMLK